MATKESVVGGPEPGSSWGPFETLKPIPRPSRHEAPAIVHVREWADRQAFELEQDAARKLVIRVPGRRGADETGTPTLGKRVIDHSFQLPLQIAWIVTLLAGCAIVYLFYGDHTPPPPVPTTP